MSPELLICLNYLGGFHVWDINDLLNLFNYLLSVNFHSAYAMSSPANFFSLVGYLGIFVNLQFEIQRPASAVVRLTQSLSLVANFGQVRLVRNMSLSLLIHETVSIVENRDINLQFCINRFYFSGTVFWRSLGNTSYLSLFLPYGQQRASTLYLVSSTPQFPQPVCTSQDGCSSRLIS